MIFDLFSKRNIEKKVNDVYSYDEIPIKFKNQFIHVLRESEIGDSSTYSTAASYRKQIQNLLEHEYGVFLDDFGTLYNFEKYIVGSECMEFLDLLELVSYIINKNKVEEINYRLKENSLGYEIIKQDEQKIKLIRIDNEHIHKEIIKPTINLLNADEYIATNNEYMTAFSHYKNKEFEQALTECGKSLESAMITVCKIKGITHKPKMRSNELIKLIFDNGIIPKMWQSKFESLQKVLENSVAPARNSLGGHGTGEIKVIPEYLVSYTLNMTASAIKFLVDGSKNM